MGDTGLITNDDLKTADPSDDDKKTKDLPVDDKAKPVDTEDREKYDPGESDVWGDFRDDKGYILGKYKRGEDLVDGYKDLTQKLREKSPEAPDSYSPVDFSGTEDEALKGVKVDTEDELYKAMIPSLKKHNIPQAAVNDMMGDFIKFGQGQKIDPAKIMAELGEGGDALRNEVVDYARSADNSDIAALAVLAGESAPALRGLHGLLKGIGEKQIPGDKGGGGFPKTKDELTAEAYAYRDANPDIDMNPQKQEHFEKLLDKAFKT